MQKPSSQQQLNKTDDHKVEEDFDFIDLKPQQPHPGLSAQSFPSQNKLSNNKINQAETAYLLQTVQPQKAQSVGNLIDLDGKQEERKDGK